MVKNTKAMSQIVTTVILVVLVLVAIGIVWGVINNLIGGAEDDISGGAECLNINIRATGVVLASGVLYDVTITRTAGGGDIDGVKATLFSDTANGGLQDLSSTIGELETETIADVTGVADANKVEITPYFNDASGDPSYCGTAEFTF